MAKKSEHQLYLPGMEKQESIRDSIIQPNTRREFLINLSMLAGTLAAISVPFIAHNYLKKINSITVPNLELALLETPVEQRHLSTRNLDYEVQQTDSDLPEKLNYEAGEFAYDLKKGEFLGGKIAVQNPSDKLIKVYFDCPFFAQDKVSDKNYAGITISPIEFSVPPFEEVPAYFYTESANSLGEKSQNVEVYWQTVENLKNKHSVFYTFPMKFKLNVSDPCDSKDSKTPEQNSVPSLERFLGNIILGN